MPLKPSLPTEFTNVTVTTKANVYFEGKVVSHTLLESDGTKRTLGLIAPGRFHFETAAPERMDIVFGRCEVQLDGEAGARTYEAGSGFDVPGNSGFTIEVLDGIAEYVCSFG